MEAAGQGEVPGGDAEPDGGGHSAGDGLVDVGPEVAVLVVDVDAALAGQFVPVLDELPDRGDAVAGGEGCRSPAMPTRQDQAQNGETDVRSRLAQGPAETSRDGRKPARWTEHWPYSVVG